MKRRQFVGSALALAATWPLRGFTSVLKGVGEIPAKTLTGAELGLPGPAIEALAAGLRGEVLLAGSQDYDRTRPATHPHDAGCAHAPLRAVRATRGHEPRGAVMSAHDAARPARGPTWQLSAAGSHL